MGWIWFLLNLVVRCQTSLDKNSNRWRFKFPGWLCQRCEGCLHYWMLPDCFPCHGPDALHIDDTVKHFRMSLSHSHSHSHSLTHSLSSSGSHGSSVTSSSSPCTTLHVGMSHAISIFFSLSPTLHTHPPPLPFAPLRRRAYLLWEDCNRLWQF